MPNHRSGPTRARGRRPRRGACSAADNDQQGAGGDGHQPAVPDPRGRAAGQRRPDAPRPATPSSGEPRPQPAVAARRPALRLRARGPDHGRRPAEQEFPRPGIGAEVGPIGPEEVGRHPHPHGRGHGQRHGGAEQGRAGSRWRRPGRRAWPPDQQRPDQVVLLLDGQRPRLLERAHRQELGEVAVTGDDLLPVGDVEQAWPGRGRGAAPAPAPGRPPRRRARARSGAPAPPAGGAGPGAPRRRPGSPVVGPPPAAWLVIR